MYGCAVESQAPHRLSPRVKQPYMHCACSNTQGTMLLACYGRQRIPRTRLQTCYYDNPYSCDDGVGCCCTLFLQTYSTNLSLIVCKVQQ